MLSESVLVALIQFVEVVVLALIAIWVRQVKHATNSLLDARVAAEGEAKLAQGRAEGVSEAIKTAEDVKALAVMVAREVLERAERVAAEKLAADRQQRTGGIR